MSVADWAVFCLMIVTGFAGLVVSVWQIAVRPIPGLVMLVAIAGAWLMMVWQFNTWGWV